jgi:hypothetical protein
VGERQAIEIKAQHYIPKLYLKGFTDQEGVLWVYEKFKPIRPSKPKHEAHRPDYYTHEEFGYRDEEAERTLARIESLAAPVLKKIGNPQYELRPEGMAALLQFVAAMFARVPNFRDFLDRLSGRIRKFLFVEEARDKQNFHSMCADYAKNIDRPLELDVEAFRQDILEGRFNLDNIPKDFSLRSMFSVAAIAQRQFKSFNFELLYAQHGQLFVTSDAPVYTLHQDGRKHAVLGMGFGWRRSEVYFPLNKRCCLRLKRGIQSQARYIEDGHVQEINRLTMFCAGQYLYVPEKVRRTARLFDEYGCKVKPGVNAFMPHPKTEDAGAKRVSR